MRRLQRVLGVLVMVLPLAACGKEPSHPPKAAEPPMIQGVSVGTVAASEFEEAAEVTGSVRSRTVTTLSSKIVGRILAMHVREGSVVQAGQLLVELDDQDIIAQRTRAEAGLREAEAAVGEVDRAIAAVAAAKVAAESQRDLAVSTLARYQQLLDRKSVAPQEYDQVAARQKAAAADVDRVEAERQAVQAKRGQVLARIESAKAEIASIDVMRSHAKITAPIAGIVTAKLADVGTMAAPGVPLLILEDHRRYWLEIAIPESFLPLIRRGQSLKVAIEAVELTGQAAVSEILPATDPATRTTTVRLDLPAKAGLKSGHFGRAWIAAGRRQAIQVAREAIVERGQLQGVYVIGQDGIARFRLIRTGATRPGGVEVLSGLAAGEAIVLKDAARVSDGAKIAR